MIKYIVIVMIFLSHSVLGQISFGGLNTAMGVMGGLQNVGGYRSPQSYFPNQYQRPNMGYQQLNQYQRPNMGYQQPNQYQRPNTGYQQPNTGYQQPNMGYQQPNMGYQQPNMGTGLGSVPLANNTPLYTRNFTLNNGYLFGQSKFYYYDPKSKKYVPWIRKNLR